MISMNALLIKVAKKYNSENNARPKRRGVIMKNTQIAENIKKLCKNKGIHIKDLLQQCGLSKSLIYDIEKRSVSPSCQTITKIADYLNCSIDYLMGRTDKPSILLTKHKDSHYIIVKSQEELDRIPNDCEDIIIIKFGTYDQPAVIHDRVNIVVTGNYCIKAYGNSLIRTINTPVYIHDKSKVTVYGDRCEIHHEFDDNDLPY